jgi:acyl-CoA synthetase (AMP-forming)/AMP-acid ligase II
VDGSKQLEKYVGVAKSAMPNLKVLVVYSDATLDESIVSQVNFPVYLWNDFLALGSSVSDSQLEDRFNSVKPGNCSTLIYTSGTTGQPKAVMVSHDNITWTAKNICENYFDLHHGDRFISYLPLSHIAAQIFDIHAPMYLGCSLHFCQPDALKGSLTVTMREARPTAFFAVPRVWGENHCVTVFTSISTFSYNTLNKFLFPHDFDVFYLLTPLLYSCLCFPSYNREDSRENGSDWPQQQRAEEVHCYVGEVSRGGAQQAMPIRRIGRETLGLQLRPRGRLQGH